MTKGGSYMAQIRIQMYKIREILRLKYECKLSNRQTAESCGINHRTVFIYWKQAQKAGIEWSRDKGLSDTELENKLWGGRPQERAGKALPDFEYLYKELKRPHVTMQLLWQEYKEENPDGYQYSWFDELYNQWRKKLGVCMRQDHRAGEKMFIDYCDGLTITNIETGEKIPTQMFVGVWGASNYTYVEASFTQEKEAWLMAHVRAFEYSGCVPRIVVPDNLRSGVNRACKYEPDINRTYLEMARHYGTTIIPTRPYKAKDKAKVEVGVLIAQRWILACLRNRTFYHLSDLNEAIRELLEKLNNRPMRKLHRSRKEMFETLDKVAALPLVQQRYEYAEWNKARVNIDYHIEVESHYYSVPYAFVHEQVDVRITGHTVEVFYKGTRQASHVRSFIKYAHTTKPEHMPESHRKYLEWTPPRIIQWAEKTGECTKEVVKTILESRKYPEQAYRSCLGILRLERYYSKERIENASRRALRYRTCSYQSIKLILATGLDKQTDFLYEQGTVISLVHENIRGKEYYRNTHEEVRSDVK
jgi:transposase